MDAHLPNLYKDYGQYSNWRNFPLDIDGLKPVERRVLLSAYKIARDKLVKSRQVDAYTIGHYHPHGECLTGDTKVLLLDGSKIEIKNLVGKENFWVYSCTEEGIIKPGLAHSARMVKKVKRLYRFYLDNGLFFECTDDHPIMTRDGHFIIAKNIKINDSLMPLNTRSEDGYTFYKDNSRTICREEKVSWMVVRNLINKNIDEMVGRTKYHVHHKNEIRHDDRPENLDLLYHKIHAAETAKNRSDESNKIISEKVKKAFETNKNNFRDIALNGLEKGREKMFSDNSPIRDKIKKKNSELLTTYNRSLQTNKILKILKQMIDDGIEINFDSYEGYRICEYNGPLWETLFKKFNSLEEAIELAKDYNHKVVNIEIIELDSEVEVYDLSVDKYHNFAIDCGIFVHNCYGTVVQLVRQGFLIGQGNFGTNVGVEPVGPAAPRYTECKMHPKTLEMAFKYIKHVPCVETELGDTEPAYLPTMFPICLMGTDYTQGIGFGFKTFIPCYTIKDLYQRLLWLLGIRKKKPTIVPISDCNIVVDKEQLELLLTTGKAKLEVNGVVEINKRNNTVALKSWPPGKRFQSFLTKFDKELGDGMIGFTDLSVEETNIVFQVIRERSRDRIFNQFLEKLYEANKGFISFELIVVDEKHNVMTKSVDQMLLDTYEAYKNANENMLNHEIENINGLITEYETLAKIRPIISSCMERKLSIDETIVEIENKTSVIKEISKGLMSKYRISKLLTLDTDTTELNNSKKELQHNIKNLNDFVLEQYNGF
jgi:hypothetical protein